MSSLQASGGEFGLIRRIRERVGEAGGVVLLGIGDDAALLNPTGNASQTVVTTDLLMEDVHFRRSWCEPYLLGWKAVAVNLSDIAAMGATPTATFLSLAAPAALAAGWIDEVIQGLHDCCREFGAQLAGGDTNLSPGPLVLSVTQMGTVFPMKAKRRVGARYGDRLLVTGALGDASAGLALLESLGLTGAEQASAAAVRRQLAPVPRVKEGQIAGDLGAVRAMMDLSDGLLADLAKLCAASGAGAVVRSDHVPVGAGARQAASHLGTDARDYALRGGEDYELLMVVTAEAAEDVRAEIEKQTGTRVTAVGEVVPGAGVAVQDAEGRYLPLPEAGGWDHFGADRWSVDGSPKGDRADG